MDTSMDTLVIEIESSAKDAGGGIDSLIDKLQKLQRNVNENLRVLGKLNSALIQLKSNSSGFSGFSKGSIEMPEISNVPSVDVDTTSMIEGANQARESIASIGDEATTTARKLDSFGSIGSSTGSKLKTALEKGSSAFQKLKVIANDSSRILKGVGSVASAMASPFIRLFSIISGRGRASMSDMGNSVNNLVKKLRMTTLALLGTRGAFTAIRKAVSEYMAYDTALAQTLQQDWAILGSLIAPILERIINLFSILVSYIATFIKMLTGVDLVAKANKKSLGGVGSSAGGTAKKVKELNKELGQLQKFDDLNVVDFPDNSGSSGGGGGGGGGGAGGISPLSLPEVDTSALDALFDFIKRGDWYGLGMEIARKFNEGISKIDFYSIEQKARQWGKNMGDLLNGITDGLDWGLLGQQIAGGLNTVMGFVNTFFDTYNFDHLGEGLAEGVNSMIETIHWEDVGQFFANKFEAVFETLYAFVLKFDWKKFGVAIATAVNSWFSTIDWGKMTSGVSIGIQGILDTITNMLKNIDFTQLASDLSSIFENLDLSGIGEKLGTTLVTALDGLSTFLSQVNWEELGNQIAQFLMSIDWMGILTSVLKVVGNAIIGLTEIMWGYMKTLYSALWTKTLAFINSTPLGKSLTNMFKEAFEMIKAVWDLVKPYFAGVFNAIKFVFEPVKDFFSNIFGTAWNLIKIVWNQVGNYFKTVFNTIAGIFSVVKNVLSGDFKGAWDAIKGIVGTWANFFKNTWNNIKNVFATVANFFGNAFRNAFNAIKSAFGAVGSFFSGIFNTIKNIFKNVGTTVGNAVGNSFSKVINSIIGFAEKHINGFIRGVNKAISLINDIPGVKIKKLTELSIPKLATGTNEIEVEGLYHLHQGEAVVPKKYNPAINNKAYSENNEKMLRKMDDLLTLLNNMETTNIVNIGNERVHKSTVRYINRENNIYGINVV